MQQIGYWNRGKRRYGRRGRSRPIWDVKSFTCHGIGISSPASMDVTDAWSREEYSSTTSCSSRKEDVFINSFAKFHQLSSSGGKEPSSAHDRWAAQLDVWFFSITKATPEFKDQISGRIQLAKSVLLRGADQKQWPFFGCRTIHMMTKWSIFFYI